MLVLFVWRSVDFIPLGLRLLIWNLCSALTLKHNPTSNRSPSTKFHAEGWAGENGESPILLVVWCSVSHAICASYVILAGSIIHSSFTNPNMNISLDFSSLNDWCHAGCNRKSQQTAWRQSACNTLHLVVVSVCYRIYDHVSLQLAMPLFICVGG